MASSSSVGPGGYGTSAVISYLQSTSFARDEKGELINATSVDTTGLKCNVEQVLNSDGTEAGYLSVSITAESVEKAKSVYQKMQAYEKSRKKELFPTGSPNQEDSSAINWAEKEWTTMDRKNSLQVHCYIPSPGNRNVYVNAPPPQKKAANQDEGTMPLPGNLHNDLITAVDLVANRRGYGLKTVSWEGYF